MSYELQVRIADGKIEATLRGNGQLDAPRGKADIGDDRLRLETVRLLQEWLGRWNVVSDIGMTHKAFPVLNTFRVLGEHLYQIVFPGDVGTGFTRSDKEAQEAGQPLRVMLNFGENASDLAALPWEFLYQHNDAGSSFYLATQTQLVLNRVLPIGRPDMQMVALPLRVLFIMCVPETDDPEQQEHMKQREEVLGSIRELEEDRERLDVRIVDHWDRDQIDAELKNAPHVVHIIGHARHIRDGGGRMRAEIELPGADGTPQWNNPQWVVELLTRYKAEGREPKLVILHLCEMKPFDFTASFERLAPELVEAGIPAVLAMQYPMSATAARRFTSTFYGRLAAGDEIDQIVQEARWDMRSRLNDDRLIGTPVLYMQSRDGRLVAEEAEIPSEGRVDPHQVSTRTIVGGGHEIKQRLKAAAWSKATDERLVTELESWIDDSTWSADAGGNERQIRQRMRLDPYVSERGPMYLAMVKALDGGRDDSAK
jgi:hypothetical protein